MTDHFATFLAESAPENESETDQLVAAAEASIFRSWQRVVTVVVHLNDAGYALKEGQDDAISITIYARYRRDIPYFGRVELNESLSLLLIDI